MRTMTRILLLGGLACSSASWAGGGIIGGGPAKLQELRPAALTGMVRLEGRVTGLRWTGRTGRSVTTLWSAPLALDALDGIPCPAGEWVELTLILEEGLTLRQGSSSVSIDPGGLSLVLAQPVRGGGAAVVVLDLPADLDPAGRSSGALVGLLEDALVAEVTVTRP